jgi:hypothetical protein
MTDDKHFEAFGIVALFGHKQIAGRISEQTIGGETFIRVDVPTGTDAYHTQLFGEGAIYSMELTDEAIAREFAKRSSSRPVSVWQAIAAGVVGFVFLYALYWVAAATNAMFTTTAPCEIDPDPVAACHAALPEWLR